MVQFKLYRTINKSNIQLHKLIKKRNKKGSEKKGGGKMMNGDLEMPKPKCMFLINDGDTVLWIVSEESMKQIQRILQESTHRIFSSFLFVVWFFF